MEHTQSLAGLAQAPEPKNYRKYEDTVTQLDFISCRMDKKEPESFWFTYCCLFEDSDFDCYYMKLCRANYEPLLSEGFLILYWAHFAFVSVYI